jgi:hypothetical protein
MNVLAMRILVASETGASQRRASECKVSDFSEHYFLLQTVRQEHGVRAKSIRSFVLTAATKEPL